MSPSPPTKAPVRGEVERARSRRPWRRLAPALALALAIAAGCALGWDQLFSLDALREHRVELLATIAARPVLAAAGFAVIYAVAVVVAPPSGSAMTVIGGFLFGVVQGVLLVVVGATVGSTALFLATRHALAEPMRRCAGPRLQRMECGFRENAASYLLALRLLPIFPFWLVNVAPAFFGVSTRTFVLTTLFGIVPGTIVYVLFGAGLGDLLDRGDAIDLSAVLTPEIIAALAGLAALSLAPIAYRRWRARSRIDGDCDGGPR